MKFKDIKSCTIGIFLSTYRQLRIKRIQLLFQENNLTFRLSTLNQVLIDQLSQITRHFKAKIIIF